MSVDWSSRPAFTVSANSSPHPSRRPRLPAGGLSNPLPDPLTPAGQLPPHLTGCVSSPVVRGQLLLTVRSLALKVPCLLTKRAFQPVTRVRLNINFFTGGALHTQISPPLQPTTKPAEITSRQIPGKVQEGLITRCLTAALRTKRTVSSLPQHPPQPADLSVWNTPLPEPVLSPTSHS